MQVGEALAGNEAVVTEAEAEHTEVGLGGQAVLHLGEISVAQVERTPGLLGEAERQRRL